MISIIINRNKIKDQEIFQSYSNKYSVFFQEYKEEGVISWMIYPFFILKRIIIVLSLIFIEDGVLQLSLVIGVSVWVIFI